jgi:hypothetical protein
MFLSSQACQLGLLNALTVGWRGVVREGRLRSSNQSQKL